MVCSPVTAMFGESNKLGTRFDFYFSTGRVVLSCDLGFLAVSEKC